MTTMNLNRDEFLLLSRTGRGPYSTRAGPRWTDEPEPRTSGRLFRKRARSGLSLRSRAGAYASSHGLGPRGRGSTRPSRTLRRIDEQAYHELEFLVGFPAEEETLL
jgi:hypothetical protein